MDKGIIRIIAKNKKNQGITKLELKEWLCYRSELSDSEREALLEDLYPAFNEIRKANEQREQEQKKRDNINKQNKEVWKANRLKDNILFRVNKEVADYLNQQPNCSKYIRNLILKDKQEKEKNVEPI